jgi:HK97 family phage portal protein
MALTQRLLRLPFGGTRRTLYTNDEIVLGLTVKGGVIAPLTMKGMTSGSHGQSIQAQVRARRELTADDTDLALAYASNPIAYRCADLRAQKVSKMPYRIVNRKTREPIPDHPFLEILHLSRRLYGKDVLYAWQHSKCVHGEAYLEKVYDRRRTLAAIRWLNPIAIEPQVQDGEIVWFDYFSDDGVTQFLPNELVYDYYHNPLDDFRGLSPMQLALQAINTGNYYRQQVNSFFQNDSTPGGILSARQGTILNEPSMNRLKKWWDEQLAGARKRYKTIFMPAPLQFEKIQQTPAPEWADLERSAVRNTCDAFGVPVPLVDFDEMRFQLSGEHMKVFYENTIIPECDNHAEDINEELMPLVDEDAVFEFDYDQIRALTDDQVKRATAVNARQMTGNLTINEARREFGKPELDGGDVLLMPTALMPVPVADLGRISELMQAKPNAEQTDARQGANAPQEDAASPDREPRKADEELTAWRKQALNKGVRKARSFKCYLLPHSVATSVREALYALPEDADRNDIRAVFETARHELKAMFEEDDLVGLVERLESAGMPEVLEYVPA